MPRRVARHRIKCRGGKSRQHFASDRDDRSGAECAFRDLAGALPRGRKAQRQKGFRWRDQNPYVIAAQLVVFTSFFSLLTIFLWIFGLTRLRVLV